jgi:hypothetical protein
MKYINSFDERFRKRVDENIDSITLNLSKGPNEVTQYLNEDFGILFEDLIMEAFLMEGLGDWVKDKFQKGKDAVEKGVDYLMDKFKQAIQWIKDGISSFSLEGLLKKVRKKILKLEKATLRELAVACEDLRQPLIENGFVSEDNKFQTKVAYKKMMGWAKADSKISGKLKVDKVGDDMDQVGDKLNKSVATDETLRYINESLGINIDMLNEEGNPYYPKGTATNRWTDHIDHSDPDYTKKTKSASNNGDDKDGKDGTNTSGADGKDGVDGKDGTNTSNNGKGKNTIYFDPEEIGGDDYEDGTKLTEESFKSGALGFFKKMWFKMGVKEAKFNSFLSIITKVGVFAIIFKVLLVAVIAMFGPIGIPAGIAGAAGLFAASAAFAPIMMLLGGLLLALGLFMIVTWFIKPYPNIYDLTAYLEAWFMAYPDGYPKGEDQMVIQREKIKILVNIEIVENLGMVE